MAGLNCRGCGLDHHMSWAAASEPATKSMGHYRWLCVADALSREKIYFYKVPLGDVGVRPPRGDASSTGR